MSSINTPSTSEDVGIQPMEPATQPTPDGTTMAPAMTDSQFLAILGAIQNQRGGYTVVNSVAPYKEIFTGENVTEYLRYFERYMDNSNMLQEKRAMTLETLTVKSLVGDVRRACEGYSWEEAKKNLKEFFMAEDNSSMDSPEARLKKLNQERLPNDYPQTIRWLTRHRFEFKNIANKFELMTTQSENVLNAIHQDILDKVSLWYKTEWDEMRNMSYGRLTQMIKQVVNNEITKAKNHRHLEEDDKDESHDLPQEPPKPKAVKAPAKTILKREPKSVAETSVDDLVAQLKDLQINVTKDMEGKMEKMFGIIQAQIDKKLTSQMMGQPQYATTIQTHSLAVNSNDLTEEQFNMQVNANYADQGRQYSCWYCTRKGHFPEDCRDLTYDRANGIADYDAASGMAWVGNHESSVPSYLVYKAKGDFGVRRLIYAWILRFPKSYLYVNAKRMQGLNNAKVSWNIQGKISDTLQEYFDKKPNLDQHGYRPPYAHPGGNTRLPTDITSGSHDDTKPRTEESTQTNFIMFDEDPETTLDDQEPKLLEVQISNVNVNMNAKKRVHVEDEEEVQAAEVPERRTMQKDSGSPSLSGQGKGPKGSDDSEVRRDQIRTRMKADIYAKKIGLTISDAVVLDPQLGKEIAEGIEDMVDGVTVVSYQTVKEKEANRNSSQNTSTLTNAIQFAGQDHEINYWNLMDDTSKIGSDVNAIHFETGNGDVIDQLDGRSRNSEEPELKKGEYVVIENEGTPHETRRVVQTIDQGTKPQPHDDEGSKDPMVNNLSLDLYLRNGDRSMAQRQELPKIMVRLNNPDGKVVEAMVDTGSEGNVISEKVAKECKLKIVDVEATTTSYTGNKLKMLGQAEAKIYLANTWVSQRFFVAPHGVTVPFILGMPFVRST
ncbi:uncharacterized protein FFFS_15808 [Fusarium fujikuroi]|nr:uncharacterized protein FFFS_15808 [Fusarium fujikuroi]